MTGSARAAGSPKRSSTERNQKEERHPPYKHWLARKKASRYQYLGDYMNQYSWAEYIHAELDEISWAMEDED